MIRYGQFCPVAKAAEVFGDRWTPIIMRELCFGTRGFGDLLAAAPLISRTVLAQRLKELADAGVVHIETKPKGKGHLYRLTSAGEDFRPIVELLSVWGQRWGQGMIDPDDFDPGMLVWGMRRQIDPAQIPAEGFVVLWAMAIKSAAICCFCAGATGELALMAARSVCNRARPGGVAAVAGRAAAGCWAGWLGGVTPWRTLFWLRNSLARSRMIVSEPAPKSCWASSVTARSVAIQIVANGFFII